MLSCRIDAPSTKRTHAVFLLESLDRALVHASTLAHRLVGEEVAQAQAVCTGQVAVEHAHFSHTRPHLELAPAGIERPEAAETPRPRPAPARSLQRALHHVELEAGEGVEQRARGHRAGVVAAALELVPRVAALAVIASTHRRDAGHALLDQPVHDHVGGCRILESVHRLLRIGRGDHRLALAFGPGADDQAAFVVQAVDAVRL